MPDYRSILRLTFGVMAAVFLVPAPAPAAAKTDVVVFRNGDRLTGEVKKLERGKLTFKTDAADTIQIEWEDVASIQASESFDIETRTGERYFGSLAPAAEVGKLEVAGVLESWTLDLRSVVRLAPIETGFWKRVDGHLDVGFSFTEADDRAQLSLGAQAEHRTRKFRRSLSLSAVVASQSEVAVTNRADLGYVFTRYLRRPRRHLLGYVSLQRNEELGIDLRSLVAAAAGWYLVQSNTEILGLAAGLAVSQERLTSEAASAEFLREGFDPNRESLELFLGLQFESFKFDTPERDVDIVLAVYPSVSDFGRVRAELSAKVRWEIARDFFVGLTLLESYDSEPLTASSSDLTLTTSLGWSF